MAERSSLGPRKGCVEQEDEKSGDYYGWTAPGTLREQCGTASGAHPIALAMLEEHVIRVIHGVFIWGEASCSLVLRPPWTWGPSSTKDRGTYTYSIIQPVRNQVHGHPVRPLPPGEGANPSLFGLSKVLKWHVRAPPSTSWSCPCLWA